MQSLNVIVNTFVNPRQAFAALKDKPFVLWVLLLTLLISTASGYHVTHAIDPAQLKAQMREKIEERMAKAEEQSGKKFSEEKVDAIVEQATSWQTKMQKFMIVIIPTMSIIFYLFLALVFFLLFKLLDSTISFRQTFSSLLHGYLPLVLKAVIASVILFFKGPIGPLEAGNLVASNPAFLADPKVQPVLYSLLSSIDLFTIWTLVLLCLGLSIVSEKKATPWVIGIWVLYIAGKVGLTALGNA